MFDKTPGYQITFVILTLKLFTTLSNISFKTLLNSILTFSSSLSIVYELSFRYTLSSSREFHGLRSGSKGAMNCQSSSRSSCPLKKLPKVFKSIVWKVRWHNLLKHICVHVECPYLSFNAGKKRLCSLSMYRSEFPVTRWSTSSKKVWDKDTVLYNNTA